MLRVCVGHAFLACLGAPILWSTAYELSPFGVVVYQLLVVFKAAWEACRAIFLSDGAVNS